MVIFEDDFGIFLYEEVSTQVCSYTALGISERKVGRFSPSMGILFRRFHAGWHSLFNCLARLLFIGI